MTFAEGEIYHVYTRGVDKRSIFQAVEDYDRFVVSLLLCNNLTRVTIRNVLTKYQGGALVNVFEHEAPEDRIVDVLAYALMPNHFHLILHEKRESGISMFMQKLMTAHSMYFNTKYDRSGPLFVRPFRAKHVADDDYLRWLFSYVHLNPLDVHQSGWKERGLSDFSRAEKFLNGYAYSSYADYFGPERPQRHILSIDALPFEARQLGSVKDMFDEYWNGNYLWAENGDKEQAEKHRLLQSTS